MKVAMSIEQTCATFQCTADQARRLYKINAAELRSMADMCDKLREEGKPKYCGYPTTVAQSAEFRAQADAFEAI